jgi:hypothetical protein
MKTHPYALSIALLSIIGTSLFAGSSVVYGSHNYYYDDDDDDDDRDNPCYNAGFEAGRTSAFNQTEQSDCRIPGQHAYYEGFISGCISSGGGDYSACSAKTK